MASESAPPAGGHAGYEVAPFIPSLEALLVLGLRALNRQWDLSGGLNTVLHHDMHHRFPTRHFSLYFTHWDRWCGSEHPDYPLTVGSGGASLAQVGWTSAIENHN